MSKPVTRHMIAVGARRVIAVILAISMVLIPVKFPTNAKAAGNTTTIVDEKFDTALSEKRESAYWSQGYSWAETHTHASYKATFTVSDEVPGFIVDHTSKISYAYITAPEGDEDAAATLQKYTVEATFERSDTAVHPIVCFLAADGNVYYLTVTSDAKGVSNWIVRYHIPKGTAYAVTADNGTNVFTMRSPTTEKVTVRVEVDGNDFTVYYYPDSTTSEMSSVEYKNVFADGVSVSSRIGVGAGGGIGTVTYESVKVTTVAECEHEYDNACDAICNVCEAEREVGEHEYDDACDATCNICGATREVEDHVYDNACDATCNICQAERQVADHVDATGDKNHDCDECGAKDVTAHTPGQVEIENVVDAKLNVKGSYDEVVYCTECGAELERETKYTAALTGAVSINGYYYATFAEALAAAQAGDEIVLHENITASAIITIDKAITLNGNGCTLTSTAARAINVDCAGAVEIKNLTVVAGERAFNIINQASTVVLNGVTATANNNAVMIATSAGAVKLTVNNSNLTGLAVVNVAGAGAQVEINNTKITNVDANSNEDYGAITVWTSATGANVVVEGGEIIVADDSNKAAIFPVDATVTGVDDVIYMVALIGDAGFTTLEEAVEYAKAGDTITLVRDVKASAIITIDKAITLNGNGCTLTSTAARAINVDCAGAVEIKNLTIVASGERAINVIQKPAVLTITNVTATAANYTVNVAASAGAAQITINGSTLNGLCVVNVSSVGAQVAVNNTTINCNDNNPTAGESYAGLSLNKEAVGGTITATGCTINIAEGSDSIIAKNAAENGTITIDGSSEDVTVMVAVITFEGSEYYYSFTSLKAAVEFAQAGQTVKLIRNITISEPIVITRDITIDGNGCTLTYTGTDRAITVENTAAGADLTVKDLTVVAPNAQRGINYNTTGALTLENVTVTAGTYAVNLPGSSNGATVVITDSELTAKVALNVWGSDIVATVNDSVLVSVDENLNDTMVYAGIQLNNNGTNIANGTVVTVNGGSITVSEGSAATSNWTSTGEAVLNNVTTNADQQVIVAITPDGAGFESLQEIANENYTGTASLIRDVTVTTPVVLPAGAVLDLNGYTLTGTVVGTTYMNGGTLITAEGIVMAAPADAMYITTNATFTMAANYNLTLVSGEIELGADWRTLPNQTVVIGADATVTIPEGMTFTVLCDVIIEGTVINNGSIVLGEADATVTADEGMTITTTAGDAVRYVGGKYIVHIHVAGEPVVENEVAADCTNNGSNDVVTYCECGKELSRETITVDALGHTEVIDEAVAPSCTETGLTEGKHCSVCGETTLAQEVLEKIAHADENGDDFCDVCKNQINGIIDGYYYENGEIVKGKGLVKVGTDYYYITSTGACYVGKITITAEKMNGYELTPGDYTFGADGAMELKNGLVDGFYYENGQIAYGKGLVKVGTDYYYITSAGSYLIGKITITAEKMNGYEFAPGDYTFGADGVMDMTVKNGLVDGFYYENGQIAYGKGLVCVDGDYYYITSAGSYLVGKITITAEKMNGYDFAPGDYTFGAEGQMEETEVKNGFVDDVYYENDKIAYGKGLVYVNDAYYYITSSGKAFTGVITITEAKMNGYGFDSGDYTFLADGTMDTTVKNGFVDGYYYENGKIAYGKGLVYVNDAYYYIMSNGKAFTGVITIKEGKLNGHNIALGDYTFGADGKMEVNG